MPCTIDYTTFAVSGKVEGGGGVTSIIKLYIYTDVRLDGVYFSGLQVRGPNLHFQPT